MSAYCMSDGILFLIFIPKCSFCKSFNLLRRSPLVLPFKTLPVQIPIRDNSRRHYSLSLAMITLSDSRLLVNRILFHFGILTVQFHRVGHIGSVYWFPSRASTGCGKAGIAGTHAIVFHDEHVPALPESI